MGCKIDFVTPLLKLSPEEATRVSFKVDCSIKMVKSYIKVFESAHDKCTIKIKVNNTGDKEELRHIIVSNTLKPVIINNTRQ